MATCKTQEELFQEILNEKTTGDESHGAFRRIMVENGLFEDDPRRLKAENAYFDRRIQELCRMGGWVDKEGKPLELFNVIRKDKEGKGKGDHYWVQMSMLKFSDQEFLVRDRLERADYFTSEAKRIYDDGCRKWGRKFQRLFHFD